MEPHASNIAAVPTYKLYKTSLKNRNLKETMRYAMIKKYGEQSYKNSEVANFKEILFYFKLFEYENTQFENSWP